VGRRLSPAQALALVPQRAPFRFVDAIVELDDARAAGTCRFPPEADFYRGHFPGDPITPGVVLVECMAQCTLVPLALFLLARDAAGDADFEKVRPLFTDASIEFAGIVRPGETVRTDARVIFWRRGKLRVEAEMRGADGRLVCSGQLAGMAVRT
jgi:3-hydroxyacyl-[acyl-carrier-protein] dehydratase